MYRVLIVEDKPADARTLAAYLARYGEEHGEKFGVTHYSCALDLAESHETFDLIFMDIGLPGIDGMEAAELLRTYDDVTPLIFVTDLARYAVRGYSVDALDFMVKPVSYYDFALRMGRAMRLMRKRSKGTLVLQNKYGVRVVSIPDLVYVSVRKHDLHYHVEGQDEPICIRGTIAGVEEQLADEPFVRVSNSHLVNIRHIRSIDGSDLTLSDGTVLQFSRPRRKPALDRIAAYLGSGA